VGDFEQCFFTESSSEERNAHGQPGNMAGRHGDVRVAGHGCERRAADAEVIAVHVIRQPRRAVRWRDERIEIVPDTCGGWARAMRAFPQVAGTRKQLLTCGQAYFIRERRPSPARRGTVAPALADSSGRQVQDNCREIWAASCPSRRSPGDPEGALSDGARVLDVRRSSRFPATARRTLSAKGKPIERWGRKASGLQALMSPRQRGCRQLRGCARQ